MFTSTDDREPDIFGTAIPGIDITHTAGRRADLNRERQQKVDEYTRLLGTIEERGDGTVKRAEKLKFESLQNLINKIDLELKDLGPEQQQQIVVSSPQGRTCRDIFGQDFSSSEWKRGEFAETVIKRLHDERLESRGLIEGVPSDGGFLVPEPKAAQVLDFLLLHSFVMSSAQVFPMTSNTLKVPALVIGDLSANYFGGITLAWTNEAATIAESKPKFAQREFTANKLAGYSPISNELLDDAVVGEKLIFDAFARALRSDLDQHFVTGTGSGQPLGILNGPSTIAVAKESGQSASTIVYDNLVKMVARLNAGSFERSEWVVHPTTIPQLLTLSLPVGTGGSQVPVMNPSSGRFTMLSRPVRISSKAKPLGTKGDIMLLDWSQYGVGLRKDLRLESSSHAKFSSDESVVRIIMRVDGQPLWPEVLVLEDGTNTVSPYIVLADRT